MKNKYLLILFFISLSSYAFSQAVVKGRVLDDQGESLIGATISLVSAKKVEGGVADADGNFSISLPDLDTYKVEIRFIGYKTHFLTLEVTENKTYLLGDIKLAEDRTQLQSVEVIGRARQDYNSD